MAKKRLGSLKKRVWKLFSRYIRLRDRLVTSKGKVSTRYGRCCSCGRKYAIKKLQAGHFIPGRRGLLLFHMQGCHSQCYGCNIMQKGNWPGYYKFMVKKYGVEVIHYLLDMHDVSFHYSEALLLRLEKRLKKLIKIEEARK